jgi:hypothetical protein
VLRWIRDVITSETRINHRAQTRRDVITSDMGVPMTYLIVSFSLCKKEKNIGTVKFLSSVVVGS